MPPPARASAAPPQRRSVRPPASRASRSHSVMPPSMRTDRAGAASPAESMMSVATNGTKRKERDYEHEGGAETNINVVVRCRGRNEREVRENSGVVFSMVDGPMGKSVELSMGPTALSNKTYHFDKVFSPAADQSMVYDEVVTPILKEVCHVILLNEDLTNSSRCLTVSIARFSPTVKLVPERRIRCPEI